MIFDWRNGLIWVTLEIEYEGNTYEIDNCIMDTGSATTAIDIDLVDFNVKKPAVIKQLIGIGGGKQEVLAQTVNKVIIDQVELTNFEIEFGNFHKEHGINGFLGNDVLSQFTVTIDYAKRKIDFKSQS
ncbi:MAG: hypothetical protein ACE5I1_24375 [bacterium]